MTISEKRWMNLVKKLSQNLFSFLIIFFLFLINLANSEEKFISSWPNNILITDGDTIKIGKEKIRLFGIDAPEIKQICKNKNNNPYACGEISKNHLRYLLRKNLNRKIYCYYSERDRYNRIVAECFIGVNSSFNINEKMILSGHAIAYLKYSKKYLEAENKARNQKLGMWGGKFDLPEEWRKKNK